MTQTEARNGLAVRTNAPIAQRPTPMAIAMESYSNPQVLAVIKDQICPGATPAEMWQFLARCVSLGLDPFSKQIYFIKRQGKVSHQIGIDGFRSIADNTGELVEIGEAEFEGEITIDGGLIVPEIARVTVVREIRGRDRSFTGTARWREFCPGQPNDFMWKKMPYHMLGKCAEAQAMRRAFPQKMGGLQTDAEAMGAEEIFAASAQMRDTAPQGPAYVEVVDQETGEVRSVRAGDEYVRMMQEQGEDTSPIVASRATVEDLKRDIDEIISDSEPVGAAPPSAPEPAPSGDGAFDFGQAMELWEAYGHVTYSKPLRAMSPEKLIEWRDGLLAKVKEAAMT